MWLGASPGNATIAGYVAVLLPGFVLGSLGYVPYSLLVAAEDFRFQAMLSLALTVATLLATLMFAKQQNVLGICFTYAIYHAASTLLSWLRALYLPKTRPLAAVSLGITTACLAFAVALLGFVLI